MGRGPQAERIPDMSHALAHLRRQASITQAGVVERVRANGGKLSVVYYQQIEAGKRFPSPPLRERILAALGADDTQLEHLLELRPWDLRGPATSESGPSSATEELHDIIERLEGHERDRLLEVAHALIRARR